MDKSRLLMAEGFFNAFQNELIELKMLRKQVEDKEEFIIRRCKTANHWIKELKYELEIAQKVVKKNDS